MTTAVTVTVPPSADYKVEVYFQRMRDAEIGGTCWTHDSTAVVQPSESRTWYLHTSLRIATIEEVPLK